MADDTPAAEGLAAQSSADPADVAELYDGWVPTRYDADLATWGYDAPERAAEMLARRIGVGPVLDAGCGSGLVGVELHRRGVTPITGGDFSPASVETARARGVYDEVVELDLNSSLDFADGRFRAVVSVGVFSYLTDSEATIAELIRVVQPGGLIVFTQRTDLWGERDFDTLLARLDDEGRCAVDISPPRPYLPKNPEFGAEIGIRYVTLTRG